MKKYKKKLLLISVILSLIIIILLLTFYNSGDNFKPDSDHSFYKSEDMVYSDGKYSLQGTTQGNGLTGGVPPVRFSM